MIGMCWFLAAFVAHPILGLISAGVTWFPLASDKRSASLRFIVGVCNMAVGSAVIWLFPFFQLGFDGNRMPTLWAVGTLFGPVMYGAMMVVFGIWKACAVFLGVRPPVPPRA